MILVAEDDADVRRLWGLFLSRLGHIAILAADATEALQRLRMDPFELVLLDLHMPLVTGAELILALRQDPELARIPILLASSDPNLSSVARDLNVRAWLPKPFNPAQLADAISRAMMPR